MKSNFPKIPLLLSILFLIFFSFAFSFFYRAVKNNNKEAQAREEEWRTEALRREEIKKLDDSVKLIDEDRAELENHFAKSSDVVPFLDTIEGLAPLVGVEAKVTSVVIAPDHSGLLVGMQSSGTFVNLYRFLTLLENSPYELEFIGLGMHQETGLDAKGEKAKIPNWNATFSMKLLSFVE